MDIQFDGDNFKGTCSDIFTDTQFNKPATVKGTFVPNLISFIKKYPSLLIVDENNQTVVVPEQPSLEIHYTGLLYKGLFSKTFRFEGEWSMTNSYIDEQGKKQFYTCNGSWKMKK